MAQHILLVDDNDDLLMMLYTMLTAKGYVVTRKDTADNILQTIREISPDIILMDMLLSGADGKEICRQIRKEERIAAIPIIMLSAHAHAAQECLEAGADAFVEKPFEMKYLLEVLSTFSH